MGEESQRTFGKIASRFSLGHGIREKEDGNKEETLNVSGNFLHWGWNCNAGRTSVLGVNLSLFFSLISIIRYIE